MPAPLPRPNIAAMRGYVPGEQSLTRVVKLNTNENPYPPAAAVLRAIADVSADALRKYPDPSARRFREVAARHHGVDPTQILAGNGSDDILTIVIRTFVGEGGRIACPVPTYSLYTTLAAIQGAAVTELPWHDGWALPTDALTRAAADLTVVVNPNAPSGTLVDPATIGELAGRVKGPVLVDEAYADFAGVDCVGLIAEHPNVIVSRSLSKGYSLAGLRFGYAIGDAAVIAEMTKVKDSYNTDALAQAGAVAALEHADIAAKTWRAVAEERDRLTASLTERGFDVLPSHANFVLATVPAGDGRTVYEDLKHAGILVRYWNAPGLADKLRITVGRPADTDVLLGALDAIFDCQPVPATQP